MTSAITSAYRAVESVEKRHRDMVANASPAAAAAMRRHGPDYVALPAATVRELLREISVLKELNREYRA